MYLHLIGEISLNISTFIYFIWFIPQLVLTFKRRQVAGLSLWMHTLLVTAYIADLVYGFGRHLPIQYRLVTIFGLVSLVIEHYQFMRYGLKQYREKISFYLLTLFFIVLFAFALYSIIDNTHSKRFYDLAGLISFIGWFTFVWPQIIKNIINRSTEGLSTKFVVLSILSGLCDVISAYTLGWDWPSKIAAPIGLVQKSFLLGQCYFYKGRSDSLKSKSILSEG